MDAATLQKFLVNRPFMAGVAISLIPSLDCASIISWDDPAQDVFGDTLVLFIMIWLLYGALIRSFFLLSLQLEGQFVGVGEPPNVNMVRYRTVRNRIFLGSMVLSYALILVGHLGDLGFAHLFGWMIPGMAAAVAIILPPTWALFLRRAP